MNAREVVSELVLDEPRSRVERSLYWSRCSSRREKNAAVPQKSYATCFFR